MGRLSTPEPQFNPLTTVIGVHGDPYPCPDVAMLDQHIAWLCHRIELAGTRFPGLLAEFRTEIDLLLDRRRWLEIERGAALPEAA